MATRPSARIFQASRAFFRQPLLRRRVQTAATPDAAAAKEAPVSFWNSSVGPKTVHFWAPIMKWALVLAGASDFTRPAESLSLNTNAALMATGAIWTRWCFVIRPRNVFLAAVNFFLFLVGTTQVTRIMLYRQSLKAEPITEQAKEMAVQTGEGMKKTAEDAKESAQKIAGK